MRPWPCPFPVAALSLASTCSSRRPRRRLAAPNSRAARGSLTSVERALGLRQDVILLVQLERLAIHLRGRTARRLRRLAKAVAQRRAVREPARGVAPAGRARARMGVAWASHGPHARRDGICATAARSRAQVHATSQRRPWRLQLRRSQRLPHGAAAAALTATATAAHPRQRRRWRRRWWRRRRCCRRWRLQPRTAATAAMTASAATDGDAQRHPTATVPHAAVMATMRPASRPSSIARAQGGWAPLCVRVRVVRGAAHRTARKTAVESSLNRYTPTMPPTAAAPMVTAFDDGSSAICTAATRGCIAAATCDEPASLVAGAWKAEASPRTAARTRRRAMTGLQKLRAPHNAVHTAVGAVVLANPEPIPAPSQALKGGTSGEQGRRARARERAGAKAPGAGAFGTPPARRPLRWLAAAARQAARWMPNQRGG